MVFKSFDKKPSTSIVDFSLSFGTISKPIPNSTISSMGTGILSGVGLRILLLNLQQVFVFQAKYNTLFLF